MIRVSVWHHQGGICLYFVLLYVYQKIVLCSGYHLKKTNTLFLLNYKSNVLVAENWETTEIGKRKIAPNPATYTNNIYSSSLFFPISVDLNILPNRNHSMNTTLQQVFFSITYLEYFLTSVKWSATALFLMAIQNLFQSTQVSKFRAKSLLLNAYYFSIIYIKKCHL